MFSRWSLSMGYSRCDCRLLSYPLAHYLVIVFLLGITICSVEASNAAVTHRRYHETSNKQNASRSDLRYQPSVEFNRPTEDFAITRNATTLPYCSKYDDTIGRWVAIPKPILEGSNVYRHFQNGDIGQAASFDMIWLPRKCSYRRFNNTTLLRAIDLLLQQGSKHTQYSDLRWSSSNDSSPSSPILHTVFFGDSALRGIFCAIYRIYMGSETEGPCMNDICGFDEKRREISIPRIHRPRSVMIGPSWLVTFYYAKSFHIKNLAKLIEHVIEKDRPYAVIVNTGAWDFYEYTKRNRDEVIRATCHNNDTQSIADYRADPFVLESVERIAQTAKRTVPTMFNVSSINNVSSDSPLHHVRLIYRNNHYNGRYGALCADEKFEKLLTNDKNSSSASWEIFDNRAISEKTWRNQTYDGFHFDWPILTYSVEDHRRVNQQLLQMKGQVPGMLAMQLAQSLLNSIFYDVLPLLL